jgi:hypothetical protein
MISHRATGFSIGWETRCPAILTPLPPALAGWRGVLCVHHGSRGRDSGVPCPPRGTGSSGRARSHVLCWRELHVGRHRPLCGACGEVPCGDIAARCDGRLLGSTRDVMAGCAQLSRRPVPVRGAVAWAVQADVRGRTDVHLRGAGEGEPAGPRLSVRAGSGLGSGHPARSLALFCSGALFEVYLTVFFVRVRRTLRIVCACGCPTRW